MSCWSPFTLTEWWRSQALAALVAANSDPITTTYSGVGLVAWDDCCGQLVVTPEATFRSQTFPSEASGDERCDIWDVAVNVLITLTRCVPSLDDQGRAPAPAALQRAHQSILQDAGTMWDVASMEMPEEHEWERARIRQTMIGGAGGCIGVETRFVIGVAEILWRP